MTRGLTAFASCAFVLAGVGAILYAASLSHSFSMTTMETGNVGTEHDDAPDVAETANVLAEQSQSFQSADSSRRVEVTTLASAPQETLDDLLPPDLLQLEQQDEVPEDSELGLRQRVKTVAQTYQQYSRVDGQPEWASPS